MNFLFFKGVPPLIPLSPDGAAHVAAEPVHGFPSDWVTQSHEARAGLEIEITEGSETEYQVWKDTLVLKVSDYFIVSAPASKTFFNLSLL